MKRKFWIAALAACMSVTALLAFTACDLGLGGNNDDDNNSNNNNNNNDPVIDNSNVTSQQITEQQWIAAYNSDYFANVVVNATQTMTEGANKQESTIVSKAAGGNGYVIISNGSGAAAVKEEHYYDGATGQSYRLSGSSWVAESDFDFYPNPLYEQMAVYKNSYSAFKYDSEAGSYVVDAETEQGAAIAAYAGELTFKYSDGKLVYVASHIVSPNRVVDYTYSIAYGSATVTKPEGIGSNQGGDENNDVPDIDNSGITSQVVTEAEWTAAFGADNFTNVAINASVIETVWGGENGTKIIESTLLSKAGNGNQYAVITTKDGKTEIIKYFYYGETRKSYKLSGNTWQQDDFMHNYPSALVDDLLFGFPSCYSAFTYDAKKGSYVIDTDTEAGEQLAQSMGDTHFKFSDGKLAYMKMEMSQNRGDVGVHAAIEYNFAYGNVTVSVPSNFNPSPSGGGGTTQNPPQSIVGMTYACTGANIQYEPLEAEDKPTLNRMYAEYGASTITILSEKEAELNVGGETYYGTYNLQGEDISFRFMIGDDRELFEGRIPWVERLELTVHFVGGDLPGVTMGLYYDAK